MGQRQDDASSFVDRFVKQVQVVGHDSIHHLLLAEVAQQHEIGEHASVVLKGAPRDARDLWVGRLTIENRRVIDERRPPLGAAEPEPRGAAGR